MKTREIIDTEESYLISLDNLMSRYYEPMQQITAKPGFFSSPILTEKEHSIIFMNITLIVEFHKNFFVELCTEYNKWPSAPMRLGKVFIRYSPFLKLYTEYTNCYQEATKTLQNCLTRTPFKNWLDAHRMENMDCVPLESLLIMPIQRIPRYRMLLEEVVKFTPEEHIDYKDLCTALETIKEIAQYINERKRESENMTKVIEIQTKIRGLNMIIVHPQRRLLKRGDLIRFTDGSREERYFYLFSDMMLSTIKSGNEQIYDGYYLIRDATIIKCKAKTDFGVKTKLGKTYWYKAESVKKKEKWVDYFLKGIQETNNLPIVCSIIILQK